MSMEFSAKPRSKKETSYTAKDIEVLEGLEPVRKRPGMYIGGTDSHALHHMAVEVIDNAMDEAVAGHARDIYVELLDKQTLLVRDNGRGIPIDPHPKYPEKSALEVILTTLHSGGKFSNKAYNTAGGLHGVGVSVVNALSEKVDVTVYRDGAEYKQTYSKGKAATELIKDTCAASKRGTQIVFTPDASIFGEKNYFKASVLYDMLKAKAYLYKGVRIHWVNHIHSDDDDKLPKKDTIYFPNGLLDYLDVLTDKKEAVATFNQELSFETGRLEWAVAWSEMLDRQVRSYCNTIYTPLGGVHEASFRLAFTRALKNFGERINEKKASNITPDDVLENAVVIISAFLQEPQFQGQTKEKLLNKEFAKQVENKIQDHADHWLVANKEQSEELLQLAISNMEQRLRKKQQKDIQRSSAAKRVPLPGKLVDCSKRNRTGTEIFLVEGDSASGSAKQARNRETQAILPLRGKVLNVATATDEKILQNQEIQNIVQALGCGMDTAFDIEKLRYEKIILMTDADVDGAHIASLLLTFFFWKMRPLLTGGHIYLAQPPLYKMTAGGKTVYAQDDKARLKLLDTTFKKFKHVEVSRFKGLGEMMAHQLKDTTMNPEKRTLLKVQINENEISNAEDFIDKLMGKKVEPRFQYIQEHAQYVKELDI